MGPLSNRITFVVSDVARDAEPLAIEPIEHALDARGVRRHVALATNTDARELVSALPLHGLLSAVHLAYTRHRPLRLSADDLWLCIAQGLARHVDANAEALRSRLVRHEGRLLLEVRNDELARDASSPTEWARTVELLCAEVQTHLGGRAALFVADFSITDACARTASQIALLSGVQQYFEYVVRSLCGIPAVTLVGTVDDFRALRTRAQVLHEFDLSWWVEALDPVLAKLEETAAKGPDVAFWQTLYKLVDASGGERVSGWINAFFPYLRDQGAERNPWFAARRSDAETGSEFDLAGLGAFPSGLASAPFVWHRLERADAMRLVAGFVGVQRARDVSDDAVAPALGWAVAPDAPARLFRPLRLHEGPGGVQLTPRDAKSLTSLASLRAQVEGDQLASVTVMLWWCPALTSLAGAAQIDALDTLNLLGCDALTSVETLADARQLRVLQLQQCANLVDVSAIASLTGLEWLLLNHCPKLVDYRAIASLERLTRLDLFGTSVPAGLQGRHEGPEAIARVRAALQA